MPTKHGAKPAGRQRRLICNWLRVSQQASRKRFHFGLPHLGGSEPSTCARFRSRPRAWRVQRRENRGVASMLAGLVLINDVFVDGSRQPARLWFGAPSTYSTSTCMLHVVRRSPTPSELPRAASFPRLEGQWKVDTWLDTPHVPQYSLWFARSSFNEDYACDHTLLYFNWPEVLLTLSSSSATSFSLGTFS